MDLRPGAVIAGRYRVDRKIGAGGMGEVWAGEHLAVGVQVALKTLLPAAALNPEIVTRFRREAYLLGRIRSDYVARVLDFVEDPTVGLVLVLEYIDGQSLAKVLAKRALEVEETIDLGCDLAAALCDLHRVHIVHRDLKPGNVILAPQPDGHMRGIVVDFGVSRMLSAGGNVDEEMTGITRADMAVGTIEYMAPEQLLNARDVTTSADIYAVGAMLFRAVAGQHVYGPTRTDTELAQNKLMVDAPALTLERKDPLARGLIEVVGRALRKRPKERYASADAMRAELGPLRDYARVMALDLDATTQEAPKVLDLILRKPVAALAATAAAAAAAPASVSSTSLPAATPQPASSVSSASVGSPSMASSAGAHAVAIRPDLVPGAKKGVSPLLLVAAVVVALAGGAAGAIVFARQLDPVARLLRGGEAPVAAAPVASPSPPPGAAPAPSAAPAAASVSASAAPSAPEPAAQTAAAEQPAPEPAAAETEAAPEADEVPTAKPFKAPKPKRPRPEPAADAPPPAEPAAPPSASSPPAPTAHATAPKPPPSAAPSKSK